MKKLNSSVDPKKVNGFLMTLYPVDTQGNKWHVEIECRKDGLIIRHDTRMPIELLESIKGNITQSMLAVTLLNNSKTSKEPKP